MTAIYSTDPLTSAMLEASTIAVSIDVMNEKAKQPLICVGITASLKVTLTNSGPAIPLRTGATPSTLSIFLPRYVTAAEVQAMHIALPSWTFAVAQGGGSLTLTYAGSDPGTWVGKLAFEITDVTVARQPTDGTFQVNSRHMPGAPSMLTQSLPLVKAAKPGNASLAEVLQVALDSRGTVYVSTALDPLANRLFMNVKNIGFEALYTGKGMPTGAQITVEFCYGATSGAIGPATPADRTDKPLGSAWNIVGGISEDQTEGWRVTPAGNSDPVPLWRLSPIGTNQNLIGTGARSNVTFDFTNIVSLTSAGHTQMIVTFTGFRKDDTTIYDDMVIVLDVVKESPPSNRGLVDFFGTGGPVVPVATSTTAIDIPLRWAMASVNRIDLITNFPGLDIYSKTYAIPPATPPALDYDNYTLRIPATTESRPVFATLQARNAAGAYLNSLQYTVYLQMMVFVDTRDGRNYPIALIRNKFWMTENLTFDDPESVVYNDFKPNEAKYGRLYKTSSKSVLNPPAGWRVPSLEDWKELFDYFGGGKSAYTALTATGTGKFAATLGGRFAPSNVESEFQDLAVVGYYHLAGESTWARFSLPDQTVYLTGAVPTGAMLSVRYVQNV